MIEITNAVQTVWPANLPLFVRISVTDWIDKGWNIDESIKLSGILKLKGVDVIDCSSGGAIPGVTIPVKPGYQVPFAERIKKETDIMTAAVGMITQLKQADEIIASAQADLVFVARESLRNAYFPFTAAQELGETMTWPVQYERAK